MELIEIARGVSVNKEYIVSILDKGDMTSQVVTLTGTYESTFPYMTLVMLLGMEEKETEHAGIDPKLQDSMKAYFDNASVFAG